MKFKVTDRLNLRSGPSLTEPVVKVIPIGEIVDSDGENWKSVTLSDGTKGFCSADFLEEISPEPTQDKISGWSSPLPKEFFNLSQKYLNEDWGLYPKFGHHTGVDYGGQGRTDIPLFACADGEIIYREIFDSPWGKSLGNYAVLYVPSVDKSFLYCHMPSDPPMLGPVKSGEQIGIMGNTGKSAGGAIHLHLEGFNGRFNIEQRSFTSLEDIKEKTFDGDEFIRLRLV
jgi:murein DD-endopeptidase MepM/ murein hydrolase activator NlpD